MHLASASSYLLSAEKCSASNVDDHYQASSAYEQTNGTWSAISKVDGYGYDGHTNTHVHTYTHTHNFTHMCMHIHKMSTIIL